MEISNHIKEIERAVNALVSECHNKCTEASNKITELILEASKQQRRIATMHMFMEENNMLDKYKAYEAENLEGCEDIINKKKEIENKCSKYIDVFGSKNPSEWIDDLDDIIDNMISLMAIDDGLDRGCANNLYSLRELQRGFKEISKAKLNKNG